MTKLMSISELLLPFILLNQASLLAALSEISDNPNTQERLLERAQKTLDLVRKVEE